MSSAIEEKSRKILQRAPLEQNPISLHRSPRGTYPIDQGTLAATSDYAVTYVPGTLTVGAAPAVPAPVLPDISAADLASTADRAYLQVVGPPVEGLPFVFSTAAGEGPIGAQIVAGLTDPRFDQVIVCVKDVCTLAAPKQKKPLRTSAGDAAMMRIGTGLLLAIGLVSMPAWAAKRDAPSAEATQQPPVPAEPQQTSASFGDWVVRCERTGQGPGAKRVCEAAQSLIVKGQQAPIAQVAFGRGADTEGSLFLTTLLPVNVAFDKPPSLALQGKDAQPVTLAWRRCLPGGCLADVKLDAGFIRALRSAPQGRLAFTDAAERTIALPLSFSGLPEALDDLGREGASH